MISARELKFRFAGKNAPSWSFRLNTHEYVPVRVETMLPEFLEAKVSEQPWIIVKPETSQLACRCFHPDCRRDHGVS